MPKVTYLIKWQNFALGCCILTLSTTFSLPGACCLVFWGLPFSLGKRNTGHVSPMHLLGLSDWGYHGRHGRYMAGEIAGLGRCSQSRRPREITRGPFLRGHRISFWTQADPLHWVCQFPLYFPLLFGLLLGKQRIWRGCAPLLHSLA